MRTALFIYMPVIHAGILEYTQNNPDQTIILLDNIQARSVNKFLERDIRALPATDIQAALETYGVNEVLIVDQTNVADVLKEYQVVYIPNDEIIEDFLTQFAPEIQTIQISLFLRWTKNISTTEYDVPEDRVVSEDLFAAEMLTTLSKTALQSPDWWRQIAAALVVDGKIISTGLNTHAPTTHTLEINGDPRSNFDAGQGVGIYTSIHAEAAALALAAKQGIATKGADAYVTTFPCPTCARSLAVAGVSRVFYRDGYSVLDAEQILKDAGIEIILIKNSPH